MKIVSLSIVIALALLLTFQGLTQEDGSKEVESDRSARVNGDPTLVEERTFPPGIQYSDELRNFRISLLPVRAKENEISDFNASLEMLLSRLEADLQEEVSEGEVSTTKFRLGKEIALDRNIPLAGRVASLSLFSKVENQEHADRVAFLLLLSSYTKDRRFYELVAEKASDDNLSVLFMIVALRTELDKKDPPVDIEQIFLRYSKLRTSEFHVPFNLPKGNETDLASIGLSFLHPRVLGQGSNDSEKYPRNELELFESFRNSDTQSFPRLLRSQLFLDILRAFREELLKRDEEQRVQLLTQLNVDMELLLSRIHQCDNVLEVLEARAIYASCIRICDIPFDKHHTFKNMPWREVRELVNEYIKPTSEEEYSNEREFNFLKQVNAIGKRWELGLLEEIQM